MSQALTEFSLEPRSLDEAYKLAEIIAKSDLVPKDYQGKPANVLIAVQMGRELGLKPMQAIQNISVVNGRPAVWGDAPLAMVMGSGLVEDVREDFDEQTWTATCSIRRKGIPSPTVRRFSQEDAKKAGLWTKAGSWSTSPKRMLQLRARGFALRDLFPDVLKGLTIGEEQQDIVDMDSTDPAQPLTAPPKIEPPKRLSERARVPANSQAIDPVADWEDAINQSDSLARLSQTWTRLAPASKNGFYHTLSPEQQRRLVQAKDARKSALESAHAATDRDPGSDG